MRSSVIGFAVWPQKGHIYPTFHLARRLVERGAHVIYYGSPKAGSIVRENGFEFRVAGLDLDDPELAKKSGRGKLRFFRELVAPAVEAIKADGVTHLFVDPVVQSAAVAGVLSGIDVTYFWVMNPPYRRGRHLPFRFARRTPNAALYRHFPRLTWWPQLLRYRWMRLWQTVRNDRTVDELVREISVARKMKVVLTSYGYRLDLPVVVLGPRGFEQSPDRSFTYLGLGVDAERREEPFVPKSSAPVVYVSLGGNFSLYPQASHIIDLVLEAAARMPTIEFVVQRPADVPSSASAPSNVTLVTNASTLAVLAQASAAIIHGGYGTIKECIVNGVPMLIVPFLFDQPNNAAKVSELGLGRVVFPRRASADAFQEALRVLLENVDYRKRIEAFREAAQQADEYEAFCARLLRRAETPPAGNALPHSESTNT